MADPAFCLPPPCCQSYEPGFAQAWRSERGGLYPATDPSPLQGLPFALQAYFPHPSATSGSDLAAGHGIYHFNLIDGHQSSPRDPPSLPLPPFDFSYSPLPENVRPLLYIPPEYVNSVT
jgi:hypothetical protein